MDIIETIHNKNSKSWIFNPPSESRFWVLLPLTFLFILQILTGLPRPELLEQFDASNLLVEFSEEIFSYPFWLQDLSHLPLFAIFSWLWYWYLKSETSIFGSLAFHISWSYACVNELSQFFVPNRFPSVGDLTMNLLGVLVSTFLYFYLSPRFLKQELN